MVEHAPGRTSHHGGRERRRAAGCLAGLPKIRLGGKTTGPPRAGIATTTNRLAPLRLAPKT
ncbi:hypothetical protein ABH920_009366 [Catenulispora sp. EB89]|uniref:hypothetical protein n=1 Tax=Catenulispora sp. EB89 TaxID=3156257 RepID=UPI003511FF9D